MVLGVMPGEEQSSVPTAGNSFFGPLVGTVSWVLAGPLKMLYCRLHQQYLLAMKNIPQGEGQGLCLHAENQMVWMDSHAYSFPTLCTSSEYVENALSEKPPTPFITNFQHK